MFETLVAQFAPAVAPVAIPVSLVFSADVKLVSDCVAADKTPDTELIVRLVPTLNPPNIEPVAMGNE